MVMYLCILCIYYFLIILFSKLHQDYFFRNMDVVKKHPNFRLFAAMNPSTDVGKKDLPVGIKNRFFFNYEFTCT